MQNCFFYEKSIYSLETKYKAVKSEEGMYRKKEITESINIKKRTQVKNR